MLYDLECYFSFLNDVDIQLILKFKNSFGKYHIVCPTKQYILKKSLKGFFSSGKCCIYVGEKDLYPLIVNFAVLKISVGEPEPEQNRLLCPYLVNI